MDKKTLDDICRIYEVNEEQARAMDVFNNTALKAGAGSGKTRVLTKRYLRILKEIPGAKIDEIVAITFTNKAAAEMKDRIRRELRLSLSAANIDTIHGFCGKLLREYFHVADLDPYFTVMEAADSETVLAEIAEKVILEYLADEGNAVVANDVMAEYSTGLFTSGRLRDEIIRLYLSVRAKGVDTGMISRENPSPVQKLAIDVVKRLDRVYTELKEDRNMLDFNDLEILTNKLLDVDDVRKRCFNRFRYFLVDEFQDVNPLQKDILYKLVTDKNGNIPAGRLFIVGDHKQSIYGFRGTDYHIFNEVCDDIKKNGLVEELSSCYRSTVNIVSTVNSIFRHLINPYEKLRAVPEREAGPQVEVITWDESILPDTAGERWKNVKGLLAKDVDRDELLAALNMEISFAGHDKKDLQGDIISARIKSLLKEGFDYGDIAILLRSRTGLKAIENSLSNENIPFCVLGGIGFWDRQEITDITALYKILFDPADLVSLLTVLRSPIFCLSDDVIFALMGIYNSAEQKSIPEALAALEGSLCDEDKKLVRRTRAILRELWGLTGLKNTYELFKRILHLTAYPAILLSLPDGMQKFRNLEKLKSIVRDFERKGIYHARQLPWYLEKLEESGAMDEEAFLDTEHSNAVKLLTIHASKGLEFRAVFIANMHGSLDSISKRYKPLFYYSSDKGIVAIGVDKDGKLKEDVNEDYLVEYRKNIEREIEDSKRIFYVAATRAKDYLAFVGQRQEIRETSGTPELNSFYRQLIYALNKEENTGSVKFINARDYLKL